MEHAVGGEAAAAQVLVLTGHALGRGPTSSPTFVAGFTSRAPRRVRVRGSVATTTATAASPMEDGNYDRDRVHICGRRLNDRAVDVEGAACHEHHE
jgi:hypothetical protein